MKPWLATGILLLSAEFVPHTRKNPPTTGDITVPKAEHWGELADANKACAIGKNQSPIDLNSKHAIKAQLSPLTLAYKAGGNEVLNNSHTIQVSYAPGSTLTLDGQAFELKQFHFHAPSENQIDITVLPHGSASGTC